jgi:hypothetical protein
MNTNEVRTINASALKELAIAMQLSDEELDDHIKRIRDVMMKNGDLHISEAILKVVENCSMNDIMTGVILAILSSDYYFDQYIERDINDNR